MTTLVKQVLSLKTRPIQDLRQLWLDLFQTEPPPYSRAYFIPRLAYRLQELSLGGMKPEAQKKLDALVKEMETGKSKQKSVLNSSQLMKGTTLVRDWEGAIHTVKVLDEGFEYQGQRYRSLSVIARKITGTHWNGPRFFGLRSEKRTQNNPSDNMRQQEILT